MKREIYIYLVLGVFTGFLLLYQFKISFNETPEFISKIEPIEDINQLSIDLDCNVFLVEGEDRHILVEGPGKVLNQIRSYTRDGCIRITRENVPVLSGIYRIFDLEENDINIYIILPDLNDIKLLDIDELNNIKFISSECLGLIISRGQKLVIESKFLNKCA